MQSSFRIKKVEPMDNGQFSKSTCNNLKKLRNYLVLLFGLVVCFSINVVWANSLTQNDKYSIY